MAGNGNGRHSDFELRLTKAEEKLIVHDKSLRGIRTLLMQGARLMIANEKKADRRMAELDERINALVNAHMETEDSLKRLQETVQRFISRSGNGHRR